MASAARSGTGTAPATPSRHRRDLVPRPAGPRPSPARRPGGAPRAAPGPAPVRRRRRTKRPVVRVRRVHASRLLDRLLHGRLWVVLIAVLLAGIVFLNVGLLELNGSIARMDARAAELARENAALRLRVARLGSSERIQREAAARGFVAVAPGRVTYLESEQGDAQVAARALEGWPRATAPGTPEGGAPPGAP